MLLGDTLQLILLVVLLSLSAFFSASETALMSLSKIRIRHMVKEKVKGAETVNKLVNDPSKLLGTILIGNNVVNIGASALATSLAIRHFGSKGVGLATGIMTLLVLVFAEITPKSLAAENSERIALRVSGLISMLTKLLGPVIKVLLMVTDLITRLLGGSKDKKKPFITEEELRTIVHVGHEEGVLESDEKQMIYNVFEFGDATVKDVMIPRMDVFALESSLTYAEILDAFRTEQYSRIPIYEEKLDHIIGILNLKDIMLYNRESGTFDIYQFIREPLFTFEFKRVTELFKEMRVKRVPMAIVVDEYGMTSGIVTIEDLVEEIVGDIQDEYDEEDQEIEVIKEDEYLVDGSMRINELNEMIGINIQTEQFETIGGFVVGEFGRLPKTGEALVYRNIRFIIESVEKNRIIRMRILT